MRHLVTDQAWTEIASGTVNIAVQRISRKLVEIQIAATDPGAGSINVGFELSNEAPWLSIPSELIGESDKVWARSRDGAATIKVRTL